MGAQWTNEVTIVTNPEPRRGEKSGIPFVVCRAVFERQEYRKAVQANVNVPNYIGITAFEETADKLMEFGVGQRVIVTGSLQEQAFTRRDGTPGTDIKLLLADIRRLEEQPVTGHQGPVPASYR
jgi:single-stranded DNA-binding protein